MEHFLERSNKEAPKEVHGIPLVIHRIWHQENIPKRMKEEIDRSIEKTPEFDNKFYTVEDCEKLITEHFEPNVLNAYKCLKPLAYKADLARYCILYKYGGVYIDSKLEILESLLPVLTEQKQIFVNEQDPNFSIYNGCIACPPNHPVFRPVLDEIIENCKKKDYKLRIICWEISKE
jgi:mannosyltransferase OCH1-like enzyme